MKRNKRILAFNNRKKIKTIEPVKPVKEFKFEKPLTTDKSINSNKENKKELKN